ncbi:MAG: hypothetical protein AAGC58_02140 [Asticcacaulis sp.]
MQRFIVAIGLCFVLTASVAADPVLKGMRPQFSFKDYPLLRSSPELECEMAVTVALLVTEGEPLDAFLWAEGESGPDCSDIFRKAGLTLRTEGLKPYTFINRPRSGPDGQIYMEYSGGCYPPCLGGGMYQFSFDKPTEPELIYDWIR